MAACQRCHEPASGTPDQPGLLRTAATQIVVTSAFSHPRHARRGAAGGRCLTCHADIPATDDRQLPRPTAKTCAVAGCHDGTAFPVTEACTKCHVDVPTTKFDVARPDERFSHAAHLPRLGGKLACASCHPAAGTSGEVVVAGHAACAACHADDFLARTPKICGACHNSTEPWRPLVADVFPRERSELGTSLEHAKHPAVCATCHTLTTPTVQLRPARGHRACSTSGCHAVAGGPPPALGSCEGCHRIGLAEQRRTERLAVPWSARARFDHGKHERAPDGTPQACVSCHLDMKAKDVLHLAAPPKSTCVPCHDGRTSFKLTGTTCTRCHAGTQEPAR
jgi:hypothetical protein